MNKKITISKLAFILIIYGLFFTYSTILFASIQTYESQCIPMDVQKEAITCPTGIKALTGKVSKRKIGIGVSKREDKQIVNLKKSLPGVSDDIVQRARSGIVGTKQKRQEDLLKREIDLTKRLIRDTPSDDSRRADIMFRLAELYSEIQEGYRFKARSLDDPVFQAIKSKNKTKAKQLMSEQEVYENKVQDWRMKSIEVYAQISKQYKRFAKRDEVLFYLAFSLEEMARDDRLQREVKGMPVPSDKEGALREKARLVYYSLLKEYPQSKFIPNAYLSFAEYYFQESQMDKAIEFYNKISRFQDSNVYGYALYKTAWCYVNIQDDARAVEQFERVINYARENPRAPDANSLARQARRELIQPYSRAFGPSKAWEYFQNVGGDMALEMMELLAEYYYNQGQWTQAIATYHRLMSIDQNSDKLCNYQYMVMECVKSSAPKPQQVEELQKTTDLMSFFLSKNHPEEAKRECRQKTAEVIADLGTHWHQEAVGSETSPGTDDPQTKDAALKLYKLLIDNYPDLDELQFEGWSQDARPTRYLISYYYADLLFQMRRWDECGPAFDKVVEMDPQGRFLEDSARGSVICFDNIYKTQYSDDKAVKRRNVPAGKSVKGKKVQQESDEERLARLRPRELTNTEKGMLESYTRYVCFVPESDELVNIKYNRAYIYYDANHVEEAAVLFRDIAFNHKNNDIGRYAANLYLDCLNIVGQLNNDKRLECSNEMADAVERFITDRFLMGDEGFASKMIELQCGILRKKAEAMQERSQFRDAALTYYRIYDEYSDKCPRMDEVLFNSAINFESAYYIGKAIEVRTKLRESFPQSEYAKKAIFQIGGNFHAIASYTKAAEYYEQFANDFPGEAEAPSALRNAVIFRLGLGMYDEAMNDVKVFEKLYKGRRPSEAATVKFSIGVIYERNKQWDKLIKHYESYLKSYQKVGSIDEQVQANTYIGYGLWNLGKIEDSLKYFGKAVSYADVGSKEGEKLEDRIARYGRMIKGVGDNEDELKLDRARRLRLMVDAIAKARFYIGEQVFIQFQKIRFPQFEPEDKLPGIVRAWLLKKKVQELGKEKANEFIRVIPYLEKEDRKMIIQQSQFDYWTEKELAPWVQTLNEIRSRAEQYFTKVVLEHVPHWEIAAAARIGDMYKASFEFFYNAPVAPIVKNDPELYDFYRGELDKQALPFKEGAVGAYQRCLEVSTSVRWFNQYSRSCEVDLNKLDPRRYPVSDEMRSGVTYEVSPLAIPTIVNKLATDEEKRIQDAIAGAGSKNKTTTQE